MNRNKNGNKRTWRRIAAAAVAGLSAAAVLMTSVLGRSIEAQAADTLIGIEKLRSRVKDSGEEYVILEIVPDKHTAEIGSFFEGFEPVLGEIKDGKWMNWKDVLASLPDEAARKDYIENKKKEAAAYYAKLGWDVSKTDEMPVRWSTEEYDEPDTPPDGSAPDTEGYEKITASGSERDGWFSGKTGDAGEELFQLAFGRLNVDDGASLQIENKVVYEVSGEPQSVMQYLAAANDPTTGAGAGAGGGFDQDNVSAGDMPSDAFLYVRSGDVTAQVYTVARTGKVPLTWNDIKDEAVEKYVEYITTGTTTSSAPEKEEDPEEDSEEDEEDPGSDDEAEESDDSDKEPGEGDGETGTDPGDGTGGDSGDETGTDPGDETGGDSGDETGTDPGDGTGGETGTDPDNGSVSGNSLDARLPQQSSASLLSTYNNGWYLLVEPDSLSGNGTGDPEEDKTGDGSGDNGDDEKKNPPGEGDEDGDDGNDDPADGDENDDPSVSENEIDDGEEEEEEEDESELDINLMATSGSVLDYFFVSFEESKDTAAASDKRYYEVTEIVPSSNGEYAFHEWDETDPALASQAHQLYTFPGKTIYCKNAFQNKEWFKKYVLNMDKKDYDDFPVKVLTYTPTELNEMEAGALPAFDFLYINSGQRTALQPEAGTAKPGAAGGDDIPWTYADTIEMPDTAGTGTVTVENDISPDVLSYLYTSAIAGAKPCLVDGSVLYTRDSEVTEGTDTFIDEGIAVNQELKDTAVFKLAALLCQREPDKHSGDYASVSVDNLLKDIVDDDDANFVNEHIYCRFETANNGGASIVNSLFGTPTIYREGSDMQEGFQIVLDVIQTDNLYREADTSGNYGQLPTDISQAIAVRHIMNYSSRRRVEPKKNIKVLEIEPAMADEPDLTLEQIKKWAPGVETADITVMTTAEFIGKIEKLNETYDLIYIGTNTDHLNMHYWLEDDGYHGKPDDSHIATGTAFNDPLMDGLFYYNIGDLRAASMPLAGQLASEYSGEYENSTLYYYNYVRYGGNDITEEKKKALLSFLDGSYPVILADDFFYKPVTVYSGGSWEDGDYRGGRVDLAAGQYTKEDLKKLGVKESDISSVKVRDGYQITLYDQDSFSGNKITYTADKSKLNQDGWSNKAVSLIVEQIKDDPPTRKINEDHIDNASYMYDFVKEAMEKNCVNFYAWSDIPEDSDTFQFYLNRPKVSMEGTANGYDKPGSGSNVRYVEAGMGGRYQLEYHFTIHNEGAASYDSRYTCKLYVDVNADGKYSAQEEMNDITLTSGGSAVSADSLYADREYMLTREVPSGYKGLLPWRIEVTQADNPNIYTSMSGYAKLVGMEKEKIKVIQIGRDKLYDMNGATWAGGENEYLFDLGAEIEKEGSYYHTLVYGGTGPDGQTYEGISDEFDIDVTFMTISDYEDAYNADPECLNDYNMLILGFSDIYGNFTGDDTSGPMSAIVEFINSGKSVLFAHDTTSFFNYPEALNVGAFTNKQYNTDQQGNVETFWGYSLNRYIRDLVGMDRYGVRAADKTGYDQAYYPKRGRETPTGEVQGYTYTTINGKDYAPGGAEKKTFTRDELDTGRSPSWSFTNAYTNIRFDQVYYNDGNTTDSDGSYGEQQYQKNAQVDNMLVTQVNEGQIVEYPYDLPEQFEIAQTHGQYYQLNYTADDDGDGQSDLVVWYCLGARSNGQETVYSQSPNDVRNNYYIYNKGNITYTGMGHSAHYEEGKRYTFDEAKLFINTMIASYQSGVKPPYITALKKGVPEADELKVMYRMYGNRDDIQSLDDLVAERSGMDTEKIYFTVQDVNFIKGTRQIAVHVYYQDDGGISEITVKGEKLRVNEIPRDNNIYNAADGTVVDNADNLTSGGVYYIEVPRSILAKSENGLDIYFEAQTTLTTYTTVEKVYQTDKVYARLQVLQAYMFNLE